MTIAPRAFETSQIRLRDDLATLATDMQERATRLASGIHAATTQQRLISAYEALMVQRAAAVAYLAARASLTVDRHTGPNLARQVEHLLGVEVDHATIADRPAVEFAAGRIRLAVQQSLDTSAEAAFAASSGHQE